MEQEAARAILRSHGVSNAVLWDGGETWCVYGLAEGSWTPTLWVCPSEALRGEDDMMVRPGPLSPRVPVVPISGPLDLRRFLMRCNTDDQMYEILGRLWRETPGIERFRA